MKRKNLGNLVIALGMPLLIGSCSPASRVYENGVPVLEKTYGGPLSIKIIKGQGNGFCLNAFSIEIRDSIGTKIGYIQGCLNDSWLRVSNQEVYQINTGTSKIIEQ